LNIQIRNLERILVCLFLLLAACQKVNLLNSPTGVPPSQIDAFVEGLLADLNARRIDELRPLLSESFDFRILPVGRQAYGREEATQAIQFTHILPDQPNVIRTAPTFPLPDEFSGEGLAPVIAAVETTGWGLSGQDRGRLLITLEDDVLRWGGLLLYEESYVPLTGLRTVAAPAGLLWQADGRYFQVDAEGESQFLFEQEQYLQISPGGEYAAIGMGGDSKITILSLASGSKTGISLPGYLLWPLMEKQWLNDIKLVIALTASKDFDIHREQFGSLALLDVASGKVEELPIPVNYYTTFSATSDRAILYTTPDGALMEWRDGQARPFALGSVRSGDETIHTLRSPVLSSDRRWLAGIVPLQPGSESLAAYVSIDLAHQTAYTLMTFHPITTESSIIQSIQWSPDDQWLAIQSRDDDLVQNGVWLVSAQGEERIFLGTASSDAVWLDAQRLTFSYVSDGRTRLQQYDLATRERAWLDLPAGDWVNTWGQGLATVSAIQVVQQDGK